MELLFKLGIVIIVGLMGGRIANYFKLPNVSGYIVAGLLLGPSFFNLIKTTEVHSFDIVNDIALAAIAFSVGSEFLLKEMIKIGKNIMIITVAEVLGAIILVFMVTFFIFNQSFEFSLVIASMSAATAPAGIIMVIRELKAQGPLVKTILPIVALDDALGIMVFGLALSLAKITSGVEKISAFRMISQPFFEIFGSLIIGFCLGLLLTYAAKRSKGRDELLSIVVAFVLAASGIASHFNVSALLANMAMGAVLVNMMQNSNRVFNLISDVTPPIYLLFFTIAGASLNLSILSTVGALGVGYVLARAFGKILGATIGAKYVKADDKVTKYLGMSLLTQGGISIGLSMIVRNELPQFSNEIITVILFSVLIFEIMGPILAKIGITKAGEVDGALLPRSKKKVELKG